MVADGLQIRFDPNQPYQQDAMSAVLDLFKGQPLAPTKFEISSGAAGTLISDYGTGNQLVISDEQLEINRDAVQERNSIPSHYREATEAHGLSRDFSVEMETGTGKTYVYLRTIIELNRLYGFTKFVIVVPSVPIREGVLASMRSLGPHFAEIYGGSTFGITQYNSKDPAKLRAFAQANDLQVLLINIDAFNKDTNLIKQPQDRMMGSRPIDLLASCRPITILDEPQNMESETAKAALAQLDPLVRIRYSATHRNVYQQVYRLTPVDAFQLGLVKQIDVWDVQEDLNANNPQIRVLSVTSSKKAVTATIEYMVDGKLRKTRAIPGQTNLAILSSSSTYAGYTVEEIRADTASVHFTNGVIVKKGEQYGPNREAIQRTQIRDTIKQHLEQERSVRERVERGEMAPMKVLSLFFIDRVANYWPADGKFRKWFVEEYEHQASLPLNAALNLPPVEEVHNGYFSVQREQPHDSSGRTQMDDVAYNLIMRDKERLASVTTPLRFIFSHSALREGWDNPNVFVICTLNDSISEVKKRQEIGRGLRLPVTSDGLRCHDPDVARLCIVANESYHSFAASLQQEITSETDVKLPSARIVNKRIDPTQAIPLGDGLNTEAFTNLWHRIQGRTTYRVDYKSEDLVDKSIELLKSKYLLGGGPEAATIRSRKATIQITDAGVEALPAGERSTVTGEVYPIPDLVGALSSVLPSVTRSTIVNVLVGCGNLDKVALNPQQFIEDVRHAIERARIDVLVAGISYELIVGDDATARYAIELFEEIPIRANFSRTYEVLNKEKSVYTRVPYDSINPELSIAQRLDQDEAVVAFVKLPRWFTVATPLGPYNPDWAYVKRDEEGHQLRLYLVRESKPTDAIDQLRPNERMKVEFGAKHFNALGVNFGVLDSADKI